MEPLSEDKTILTHDVPSKEYIDTSNLMQEDEKTKEKFDKTEDNFIDLDDILKQHTIFKLERENYDLKESDAFNKIPEVPIISDLDNQMCKYNTVNENGNIESGAISAENIIDISNFMDEIEREDRVMQDSKNTSVKIEESSDFDWIKNIIHNFGTDDNINSLNIQTSGDFHAHDPVFLDLDSPIAKNEVPIKEPIDNVQKDIEKTCDLLETDDNLDVITVYSSEENLDKVEPISLYSIEEFSPDSKYTTEDYHSSFLKFITDNAHLNSDKTNEEPAKDKDQINIKTNTKEQSDDDSICDSYHSSDFEFISEDEAKLDGLIINFKPGKFKTKGHTRTIYVEEDRSYQTKHLNWTEAGPSSRTDYEQYRPSYKHNSIEEPSTSNKHANDENASSFNRQAGPRWRPDYEKYRYYPQYQDKPVENHRIPEGQDYLNLFQGPHNPMFSHFTYLILENKSIVPTPGMNIEFEGIGFDLRRHAVVEVVDEELTKEAESSTDNILRTYPSANRRFKRKRH